MEEAKVISGDADRKYEEVIGVLLTCVLLSNISAVLCSLKNCIVPPNCLYGCLFVLSSRRAMATRVDVDEHQVAQLSEKLLEASALLRLTEGRADEVS